MRDRVRVRVLMMLLLIFESFAGRLYQTLPCRSQNLLQEPQASLLAHSFNSQMSTLPPVFSASPSTYGNYQNCTIVQSHRLSSFGAHSTLAPKTLIFPIFVQVGTCMVRTSIPTWNPERSYFTLGYVNPDELGLNVTLTCTASGSMHT